VLPLITTDLSGTVTQADLVPTVLAYLCIANDPTWQLDGRSIIPVCAPVQVQVRTLLSGPDDGLRNAGLVPLNEPYTALGYDHRMKGGGEATTNAVLTVSGPDAVVDWIVLEQRDAVDPTRVLATRSCLLQRDGDVVGMDGTSWPLWPLVLGNHHLAVHHRNHFGAMSLLPISFSLSGATVLDLSDPATPVFGAQPMTTSGTARLHWAGDVLRNGTIKYTGAGNDRDPILLRIGGTVPTNTGTWMAW
jgi:hypothetical protein